MKVDGCLIFFFSFYKVYRKFHVCVQEKGNVRAFFINHIQVHNVDEFSFQKKKKT